jgi:hypothetical protein
MNPRIPPVRGGSGGRPGRPGARLGPDVVPRRDPDGVAGRRGWSGFGVAWWLARGAGFGQDDHDVSGFDVPEQVREPDVRGGEDHGRGIRAG